MPLATRLIAIAAVVAGLSGCASTIRENHYFAAFKEGQGGAREPVQFYRVQVDGSTQMANARYLTGYFDERAVSLFFNELRGPAGGKLFDESMTLPGSGGTKIQPLSPTAGEGAFVLIMSSNADSIANTIGSFAESQVVADSLTRLVNKDRFVAKARSDATLRVQKAEATALSAQLDAHTRAAKAADSGTKAAASYARALTVLARGLGYSGAEFASIDQAQAWFTLEATNTGGTK